MSSSKSSDSNLRELEERLDFLLSVEVDDELSSAERDELSAIRRDSPDVVAQLTARRAEFATGDTLLRRVVGSPAASTERVAVDSSATADADFEASLQRSFEAIQARLADSSDIGLGSALGSEADLSPSERANAVDPDEPVDELAKRRRASRSWVPPVVLAAAAAWVLYLVVPTDGSSPSSTYLEMDLAAETASGGLSATESAEESAKEARPLRKSNAEADAMLAQADASPSALRDTLPPAPSPAQRSAKAVTPSTATASKPSIPIADRSAKSAAPAPSLVPSSSPSVAPQQIAQQSARPRAESLVRSKAAENFAAADSAVGDLATAMRPSLTAASAVPVQANGGLATLQESSGARTDDGFEPLELAIMFGPDEGGGEPGSAEALSAEDFEIIEQLELLEYLATQSGGRG